MMTTFENFLNTFNENDWLKTLEKLLPVIHEVDRNATQIWFSFYPLALHKYLQTAKDKAVAVQQFVMQGKFELKDQLDSSHHFFYGHRFWAEISSTQELLQAMSKILCVYRLMGLRQQMIREKTKMKFVSIVRAHD